MRKKIIAVSAGLITLIALSIAMLSAAAGSGHDELMVEVSITNLTRGQILSPVFVARHDRNAPRSLRVGTTCQRRVGGYGGGRRRCRPVGTICP